MKMSIYLTLIVLVMSIQLIGAETIKLRNSKLYNAQVMEDGDERVMMKDYVRDGKNVVFTFFADWCLPCHEELDSLNRLADKFKLLYNTEIIAVAIDSKGNEERIMEFVRTKKLKFKVLFDSRDEAKNNYQIYALPFTMVVNTKGNLVYQSQGFSKEKFSTLKQVLNEIKYYIY